MDSIKKIKLSPIITIAALIIIMAGMIAAKSMMVSILMSVFISIILAKPIIWLGERKVPGFVAILIILTGLVLLIMGFGGIIGSSIRQFSQDVPKYEEMLEVFIGNLANDMNTMGFTLESDQIMEVIDPGKLLSFTTNAIGQFGSLMGNSFEIFFIVLFILFELSAFSKKAMYIRQNYNLKMDKLVEVGFSIRNYLWIKTLTSLLTGFLVYLWLLIIGVDYALLWGLLAFLLNYIPNIGSIIAAVPTALLALLVGGIPLFLLTMVGYLVVNMVVGNIIEPKIMGQGLGLSTLVVFLSLIFWGYFFGTVGMFLSVPLTMSIKILLEGQQSTQWIAVMLGTGNEIKNKESGTNREPQEAV